MPHKSKVSLPTQMGIGLLLGVMAGVLAPTLNIDTATWFQPLGQLFINLIRMVVVPLVLATIVAGAAGIHDVSKLGRVAGKTLLYYFLTTAVALALGLVLANLLNPGSGISIATEGLSSKNVVPPKFIDTLMGIVPINPFDALSKGNMLQVIFFAVLFGFAISSLGPSGRPIQVFFELFGDVMIRMTNIVMMYAPIGVFGLMAYTVSLHGLSVLLPLFKLIAVMYLACCIHVLLVYVPLVATITGIRPTTFLRGLFAPLLVAFSTCSSAAALPVNLTAVRRLGASKAVSSFSIPLGNTLNMDGTGIYMAVCSVFAATLYGIDLTIDDQIMILLMGVLASVGTAGVPGGGLIMSSMVFAQVGIPLEALTLVGGIDRIMDMARTTLNVLGDATGALVISKFEGDFGQEPFEEKLEEGDIQIGTETYYHKD